MKSEVIIRFAALEDAGLLARLGRETFHDAFVNHPMMPTNDLSLYLNEAFTVAHLTLELEEPKALFLLVEVSGEPAGYAKLLANARTSVIESDNPVKLQRLYSRQNYIGSGIGHSLMNRCLLEAAKSGHDAIWLSVWEHNLRAQAFYRKWKFEQCGTIDFLLGQSTLTDFLMKREI